MQDSYDLGTTLVTLDNLLEISCVFLHELLVRKNVEDDGIDRAKRKIAVCIDSSFALSMTSNLFILNLAPLAYLNLILIKFYESIDLGLSYC